jgi:hypothetical protein
MDDLIGRLVAPVGVDRAAAGKVIGIIPQSAKSSARSPASASSSHV